MNIERRIQKYEVVLCSPHKKSHPIGYQTICSPTHQQSTAFTSHFEAFRKSKYPWSLTPAWAFFDSITVEEQHAGRCELCRSLPLLFIDTASVETILVQASTRQEPPVVRQLDCRTRLMQEFHSTGPLRIENPEQESIILEKLFLFIPHRGLYAGKPTG
jgi:hypothetical protein